MTFARSDIIAIIDKRLDRGTWPPDGKVTASSLKIRGAVRSAYAEFSDDASGWSWLELGYGAKRGRLIVCGFGIMSKWDAGPTPRYLLARLFERLEIRDKKTPSP